MEEPWGFNLSRFTAFLLSFFCVLGVSVSLVGSATAADGTVEPAWVAEDAFSFHGLDAHSTEGGFDADNIAAQVRAVKNEHQQEISTSGAEAARADSLDAFSNLGRAAIVNLITTVFADPLDALTTLPTDPLLGSETAPKFNAGSDTSVRIDPPGPEGSELVVSDTPLRNDDGQIVSGQLEVADSGFEPKAPLANVALPANARGNVALSDVGVDVSFAGADNVTGRLVDAADDPGKEMVLYPNSQVDTDTAVIYTLNGIETFNYLRSEESPESFALDYSLPAGAALQSTVDGGAVVLSSEGKALVTVLPPYAVDAQSTNVPMNLSVDGNRIVLDVPHRGKNFAYPIMVDPIQHVRDWWTNGSSPGFEGWSFYQDGTTQYNSSLDCPPSLASVDPCGGTGAGVYVSAVPTRTYPAGSKAYWRWVAPGGASSSITGATLSSWRYRKGNTNPGWAFYNLYNPTTDTSNGTTTSDGGGGSGLTLTGGTSGFKYLHSGLATNTANTIPTGASNWRYNRIAGYSVSLTDGEAPSLDLDGEPTTWLGANQTINLDSASKDLGLGLGWVQYRLNSGSWSNKWLGWCTGTYPYPCPNTEVDQSVSLNTNDLPNGKSVASFKAIDILTGSGHETEKSASVYVDKTSPVISSISPVVANTDTAITGPMDLSLDVSDATSGVRIIEFFLDDEMIYSTESACEGTEVCSLDPTMEIDLSGRTAGSHDWKIQVSDAAGNSTVREGTMSLTPGDPISEEGEFETEGDEYPVIGVNSLGEVSTFAVSADAPAPTFEPSSGQGSIQSQGGIRYGAIFCQTTGPTPWISGKFLLEYSLSQCYGNPNTSGFQGQKVKTCIEHRNSHWWPYPDTWPDDKCKAVEYKPSQVLNARGSSFAIDCTGKDYRGHFINTLKVKGTWDARSHYRTNIIHCD